MPVVKIAFATEKGGLDDKIADRFGRAPTFTIVEVDTDTGEVKSVRVVENPGASAGSGAGVKAAQKVADEGAKIYVGPNPGPNAYAALQYLGVKIYVLTGTTVREALQKVLEEIRSGTLQP
jgi:predicted Fe-Mo cluster-binding NifX family protein